MPSPALSNVTIGHSGGDASKGGWHCRDAAWATCNWVADAICAAVWEERAIKQKGSVAVSSSDLYPAHPNCIGQDFTVWVCWSSSPLSCWHNIWPVRCAAGQWLRTWWVLLGVQWAPVFVRRQPGHCLTSEITELCWQALRGAKEMASLCWREWMIQPWGRSTAEKKNLKGVFLGGSISLSYRQWPSWGTAPWTASWSQVQQVGDFYAELWSEPICRVKSDACLSF